jgi:hypothetical protein
MPTQIHLLLAVTSVATTALVAAEAGWRALRDLHRGALSSWLSAAQLIALAMTCIAGLGSVMLGRQPHNTIHYLLAVVALILGPVVSTFLVRSGERVRAAVMSATAVLTLVIVACLFMTG